MHRLAEAKAVLCSLGLPEGQQNDIAAYTLLALAGMEKRSRWAEAKSEPIRIHEIIVFVKQYYRKTYAENTRETFRRQVLHQFEQANVVLRNPGNPSLPTNSPRTCYALGKDALAVVRTFGSTHFEAEVRAFQKSHGRLADVYRAERKMQAIRVRTPSGLVALSPGKHNLLQKRIVEDFRGHFAPGARLLYLGDAAKKSLQVDEEGLRAIGMKITEHDKLPDILLHWEERNWVFLIEAVTSHGPVSPKRLHELETFFKNCRAKRVYVSAFPDFGEFKRHLGSIAWETEVWIAERPDHMIHYNGEKFLGPSK
ncbi:MAG: BsuBI/PstI family type II restriction endonuclease [Candidatus Coatesbacteria bacterium]